MASRTQKIRLAVFFVVASGMLTAFVLAIAGMHFVQQRDVYFIEFEGVSVSGLHIGAQVKYQGITVGRVEDIYISPEAIGVVVVKISVEPGRVHQAIREDTRAVIYHLGITGLKYLELLPGSSASEPLPPGSLIPSSETFLSDIDRQAEVLTSKLEILLDRASILLGPQNQRHLASTLESTSQLTETANALVAGSQPQVDTVLANMALASGALAGTAVTMQATMDSLHAMLVSESTQRFLADVQESARSINQTVQGPLPDLIHSIDELTRNMDQTVLHVDQTVLQSRSSVLNAMRDLEETLQNLRELSELVRDNPSLLIRGGTRPDGS